MMVDTSEKSAFQPEYSFPFDPKSNTEGILPNGEKFKILIDTGAICSYVAYTFYLESDYLRSLPKYTPARPESIWAMESGLPLSILSL